MSKHKTSIGGQALIEGVMMKGAKNAALAVRVPSGDIKVESFKIISIKDKNKLMSLPFIRGSINFVEMLFLGYKCLMRSAELSEYAEELKSSNSKQGKDTSEKKENQALLKLITFLSAALGIVVALALFIAVPMYSTIFIEKYLPIGGYKTLIEGSIKIIILFIYIALISRMKDIRRVFQYHGAEHKTIACYEDGCELTVDEVKKHSRFHPRCGTSFLLIVFIIGILIFMFVTWDNIYIRLLLRLLLLPVVVGISYEIIKLAGRYDNVFTRIISAPGLLFQRLTTGEPDDSQIEVAIAAFNAVVTEDKEEDRW